MAAALGALVAAAAYKPGWRFRLAHGATSAAFSCWDWGLPDGLGASAALTVPFGVMAWPARLVICLRTRDSLPPHRVVVVEHTFAVPDDPGMPWHAWLLECIHRVEIHEMCEAFSVGGERPFFPEHGPAAGARMYEVIDRGLPEPGYPEP